MEKADNTTKLTSHQKDVVKKFLRIIFFINSYHNKILHRQLELTTKQLVKDIQQNNENYAIFPELNYSQFIESIKYFIENIANNEEVQAILKETYVKYLSDKDLDSIFDEKKEAIFLENDTIKFKINSDEINDAIDCLNNVKIFDDDLETLCNNTSWDQKKEKKNIN